MTRETESQHFEETQSVTNIVARVRETIHYHNLGAPRVRESACVRTDSKTSQTCNNPHLGKWINGLQQCAQLLECIWQSSEMMAAITQCDPWMTHSTRN